MRSDFFSSALLLVMALGHSQAHAAGDPQAGALLAKEHCARCHDIAPGGVFKHYPPSFAAIAAYRSEEQMYARIVFPAMHSGMPEVALYLLDQDQLTNIISYIMSLEKKAP